MTNPVEQMIRMFGPPGAGKSHTTKSKVLTTGVAAPGDDETPYGHDGGFWMVSHLDFSKPNSDGVYGPCGHAGRERQTRDLRGSVRLKLLDHTVTFNSLEPFAQSYVDALMDDLLYFQESVLRVSFDMFAPDTIMRVIRDCAEADRMFKDHGLEAGGLEFWVDRLNENLPRCEHFADFQPVIPCLTSKGQIMLVAEQADI